MKKFLILIVVSIVTIQLWEISLQWYVNWVMQVDSKPQVIYLDEIIITPKNSE